MMRTLANNAEFIGRVIVEILGDVPVYTEYLEALSPVLFPRDAMILAMRR